MKKLSFLIALYCFSLYGQAQSSPNTLDVVSWNVEFFGAPYNSGPPDKNLQESNVKKIMRYLNADLYGLLEVVDTMRLRRLVDSLGNSEFGYVVAPYCSNNTTGTGASWTSGQKQAYIYRKSIFSNVTTRGIMRNSGFAYANWASGRFPFLLSATVTINGNSRNLNFILLHGKSGSTVEDFNRRQAAANELKDTLDTYFSTANTYIIGDFNDALQNSIYTGSPISSYNSIVADSTDGDSYRSITLPLGASGQTSMINFPNVIDNHILSNEVALLYRPGTARIVTDVMSVVPDYVTAHNTSDHYPVFSQYDLNGVVTGIPVVSAGELGITVTPNPFFGTLNIRAGRTLKQTTLNLYSADGRMVCRRSIPLMTAGTMTEISIPGLPAGLYFLQVQTGNRQTIVKLVHP